LASYQLVLFVVDLVLVRTRSDVQLRAEVLALRHQLRTTRRSRIEASNSAAQIPP